MTPADWSPFRAHLDQLDALFKDKKYTAHLEHLREIADGTFFERTLYAFLFEKFNDKTLLAFLDDYARLENAAIVNLTEYLRHNTPLMELLTKEHGHLLNFYEGLLTNHKNAQQKLEQIREFLRVNNSNYLYYVRDKMSAIKSPDNPDDEHTAFAALYKNRLDLAYSIVSRAKKDNSNAEEIDRFATALHHALKDYLMNVFIERHYFYEMLRKMPATAKPASVKPAIPEYSMA